MVIQERRWFDAKSAQGICVNHRSKHVTKITSVTYRQYSFFSCPCRPLISSTVQFSSPSDTRHPKAECAVCCLFAHANKAITSLKELHVERMRCGLFNWLIELFILFVKCLELIETTVIIRTCCTFISQKKNKISWKVYWTVCLWRDEISEVLLSTFWWQPQQTTSSCFELLFSTKLSK